MNKKTEFTVSKVGVDSGTIMICDEDFFQNYGYKFDPNLSKKKKISPGKYNCVWEIRKTWCGDVSGSGILEVKSGNIIISDPCYCIEEHDQWMELLNQTDYLKNAPDGTLVLDKMGGDGEYTVEIKLFKI
jgi:hypothetical protein